MATISFRSILVPVDGSASAAGALRVALKRVRSGGEIIVAHAIDRASIVARSVTPYGGDAGPALAAAESDERKIFIRAAEQARAAGIRFSLLDLDGPPVDVICAAAVERRVDAIAMGTHGRGGIARMMMGNTALGVIRRAVVPVLVVPERHAEQAGARLRTIVAAIDSSPAAENAARAAVDLAAIDGGRVVFVHAQTDADDARCAPSIAAAVVYAGAARVASDTIAAQGRPAEAVVRSATAARADLITIGATGSSAKPFGSGSVAQAVVLTSRVPLLVLPPRLAHALPAPLEQCEEFVGRLSREGHIRDA